MATDADAHPAGVDPHQVAEVIVTLPGGVRRRGSGYRTGAGVVLTAAHVVQAAGTVQVRFDADTPDEWSVEAGEIVADPASDLAVVRIEASAGTRRAGAPAFGRVGTATAEFAVHAVGFPRFKLKRYSEDASDSSYRDSHQATGTVAPLSNRRSGRLEVTVRPPAQDPDPRTSPWEGMSGAALWADDRVIGVITEHHRSDGLGRLTAARIDHLAEAMTGSTAERLRDLLGIPPSADDLTDATARTLVATYRHEVLDIAPDRLLDREDQLRELTAFAGSDEPYGWWEGEPWAGKTALVAWFALHPPPDVAVVPFFVAAGRDGDFLGVVCEQLALLSGRVPGTPPRAVRRRDLLALLETAALRCREAGRRLVLAVDGLDEDTTATRGTASIAALLPHRPPAGTSVLVTSRPGQALPLDVPADHPLQRCARRRVPVSPHARDLGSFARRELAGLLRAGPVHEDLLGLITASGGGLGRDDLAELTGESPFALEEILTGAFGRCVATRSQRLAGSGSGRGYVLAHRVLREMAEREFGARLVHHRERLHTWCDAYRRRGWPAGTPAYLLHGYPRMLAVTGDADRLCHLATDERRHERMLDVTGGDSLALDEIALARSVGRLHPADPTAAVLLAVRREELTTRNRHTPVGLPAVWAALGRPVRAEALARGIPQCKRRTAALAAAARAAARAGYLDHAEVLVAQVPDPDRRGAALAGAATAGAGHDPARAERWAHRCAPERRVAVLARIATTIATVDPARAGALVTGLVSAPAGPAGRVAIAVAAAAVGEPDLAETLVEDIAPASRRVRARADLAAALVASGDVGRAATIIRDIRRPDARLPALAALVRAEVLRAGGAGRRHLAALLDTARAASHRGRTVGELLALAVAVADRDSATAADLLTEVHHLVADIVEPGHREWALARLAVGHSALSENERSEELLEGIHDGDRLADALTGIAVDAARRGEPERAASAVRRVPGVGRRIQAHTDLARALAAHGDHLHAAAEAAEAERMARAASEPRRLATLATRIVHGLAGIGEPGAARGTALRIANPSARESALTRLAEAFAASGDVDAAADIAGALDDPERRTWALLAICGAHAAAGDRAAFLGAAEAASTDVAHLADRYSRVVALQRLTAAAQRVGAREAADRFAVAAGTVAERIADPGQRARAFALLSGTPGSASEKQARDLARRAVALLDGIADTGRRDRAGTRVVEAFAEAGRLDQAEEVSRAVTNPAGRVRALSAAAVATALSGDPHRAWTLLGRAESLLGAVDGAERHATTGRLASAAATVLTASGDPADDRRAWLARLVTDLLGTDGWDEAIAALAQLDRSALRTLVDWHSSRVEARTPDRPARRTLGEI